MILKSTDRKKTIHLLLGKRQTLEKQGLGYAETGAVISLKLDTLGERFVSSFNKKPTRACFLCEQKDHLILVHHKNPIQKVQKMVMKSKDIKLFH